MFKHIAILVPAVAKSFHANANELKNKKASVQQQFGKMAGFVLPSPRQVFPPDIILKKHSHLVFTYHSLE